MPDAPGWWWLCDGGAYRAVLVAVRQYRDEPDGLSVPEDDGCDVEWSDYDWLSPVLTPAESAALLARAEAAEARAESAFRAGLSIGSRNPGIHEDADRVVATHFGRTAMEATDAE